MKIEIVRSLPQAVWRNFVNNHQRGNIFHTPEMFEVFSKTKSHKPDFWAAITNDNILALLLPVQITVLGGIFQSLSTRSVVYGSLLYVLGKEGEEAAAKLLQAYTSSKNGMTLFTELRNLSDMKEIQPVLKDQGFLYEEHLNYLVGLTLPTEFIFQKIGPRTRKNIRRAIKHGKVSIKEATALPEVQSCYDLIEQTYQKARIPLADNSLFQAAYQVLYPKGMVRFTVAEVDCVPAAVSVDLLYKSTMFGWFGGTDRMYGSYTPNELLTWEILKWGAENGYTIYDFGGAGRPDEKYKVRDFKAKFGGELVSYGRNTFVHAPMRLKVSKFAYDILRSVNGVNGLSLNARTRWRELIGRVGRAFSFRSTASR